MNTPAATSLEPRGLRQRMRAILPASAIQAYRGARRATSYLPRQALGSITRVQTREPVVAVTFDDGPDPRSTPRYLEVLERHGAHGTFFVIGRSAVKYPALVQRIRDGGHAIGNHSWDHPSFPAIPGAMRRAQIKAWADVLGPVAPKIFRPPYGNQTWVTRLDPLWMGWQVITWDVCANDWLDDSAETMAGRVISQIRPGSIVLMHDTLYRYERADYAPRDTSIQTLTLVLERLGKQFRFVTVPELLQLGRPQRELWYQPGDAGYLARLQGA